MAWQRKSSRLHSAPRAIQFATNTAILAIYIALNVGKGRVHHRLSGSIPL